MGNEHDLQELIEFIHHLGHSLALLYEDISQRLEYIDVILELLKSEYGILEQIAVLSRRKRVIVMIVLFIPAFHNISEFVQETQKAASARQC
jgi:hypothetical protein